MTVVSDEQLLARCRAGENPAWNELVERYSRYVYAICTQGFRLGDHDAEDVFQDVFTRVYTHLDRLREDASFRPWLAQLTRRSCLDQLRSSAREEVADEVEPGDVDETLSLLDDALTVHTAMAALSESCRDILDRFFARDESYQTIGVALDIPPGTIASRISRCLGKLREFFEGRKPSSEPS